MFNLKATCFIVPFPSLIVQGDSAGFEFVEFLIGPFLADEHGVIPVVFNEYDVAH